MDVEDDFFGDDTSNNDYAVDQKSTERLLSEIRASGFRDSFQEHMEDEQHLQLGFDMAYPLICRIAFISGKIRSFGIYSNLMKGNSALLAHLNAKLEAIEKYSFHLYLDWSIVSSSSEKCVPAAGEFTVVLNELELRLTRFYEACLKLDENDLKVEFFDELSLNSEMLGRLSAYENNDAALEKIEEKKVAGLNSLVNDLNLAF